jgi:hypothetical protein
VNLRRGLFRVTLVASVLAGIFFMLLYPKPSLENFRWRPATEAEKADIRKWEAANAGKDPKSLSPADSDKLLDAFLIEHGGTVMKKEHQGVLPVQFVAMYYITPFVVAMIGVWGVYWLIRLIFIGYIGSGFKS